MFTAVCYARTVYLWFSYIIANSDYFHKQQQQ